MALRTNLVQKTWTTNHKTRALDDWLGGSCVNDQKDSGPTGTLNDEIRYSMLESPKTTEDSTSPHRGGKDSHRLKGRIYEVHVGQ